MCYFDNATSRTKLTVDAICYELKNPKLGEVELIVGVGFSGTLLLAAIHVQSGIPFGAIRKDRNNTHSGRTVETGGIIYLKGHERYVIIDDFTESGKTLSSIMVEMSGHECVGIILYQCDRAFLERYDNDLNIVMHDNRIGTLDNIPLITLGCDIKEIEEESADIV